MPVSFQSCRENAAASVLRGGTERASEGLSRRSQLSSTRDGQHGRTRWLLAMQTISPPQVRGWRGLSAAPVLPVPAPLCLGWAVQALPLQREGDGCPHSMPGTLGSPRPGATQRLTQLTPQHTGRPRLHPHPPPPPPSNCSDPDRPGAARAPSPDEAQSL